MDNSRREALFAQGVAEHMGILLKTAHGFAAEPADRDDLVQEILLSVWQALPWFDEARCKLSTFLYRVANNRALNWHRSRRRYRHKLEGFQNYPQLILISPESETNDHRLEWLYELIRKLPPLDRTLLMLQLDKLSHREIAEITGLTETNVGVRLHRIRQSLSNQKPKNDHEL